MFIIRKLARLFILVFGIVCAAFFTVHYGFETDHADTVIRYVHFLHQIRHIDFGVSAATGLPILSEMLSRWPATMELGIVAMIISIISGVAFGVIAAARPKSMLDHFLTGASLVGYSMPTFWLALVLILLFSIQMDLTPVSGRLDVMYDVPSVTGFMIIDTLLKPIKKQYHYGAFYSAISHLILPAVVLASVPTAVFARMTRATMLEVLSKDFILSARARGLGECRIILIHGLRNALIPILSVGGLHFIATVMMGSIAVEVIFGWPGIGSYIMQSIYARDYGVVQAFLLSMGIMVLILNSLIDFIIYLISPRALKI